jgi:hypothetical protein
MITSIVNKDSRSDSSSGCRSATGGSARTSWWLAPIFLEDLLGARVDLVTESGLRDRVRPHVEKEAIRVA